MKPVLKYPGSKWRIAGEIVARIPEHHTYLEPFFGSGAVFFSKEPSRIEMINDLDNNVPNLFRCIRDDPGRLARIVATTPYSRHEYERAFASNEEQDDFQRAADFLTTCWQGHGFRTNGYRVGWKNDVHGRESMYALRNWYNLPEVILETAERLRCVQIDNRPLAVCPDRQQTGTGSNKEVRLSGCFHVHRSSVYPGNQDGKAVQA